MQWQTFSRTKLERLVNEMAWASDSERGTGLRPAQYFEKLVKANFPGGPTFRLPRNFKLTDALHGDPWPIFAVKGHATDG